MICAYYSPEEQAAMKSVKDGQLNELLQEVNNAFDNMWMLKEISITTRKRLFGKKQTTTLYSLYVRIHDYEVQGINFHQDHDWSINTHVRKSYIMAYLHGLIAGAANHRKLNSTLKR